MFAATPSPSSINKSVHQSIHKSVSSIDVRMINDSLLQINNSSVESPPPLPPKKKWTQSTSNPVIIANKIPRFRSHLNKYQKPAPLQNRYKLTFNDDGVCTLVNLSNNIKKTANGCYLFVYPVDKNEFILGEVGKIDGHTSLTQEPNANKDNYNPSDVLYAGEMECQ